jgi:uncharacterized membrane protein HdeD (DUF308 family)
LTSYDCPAGAGYPAPATDATTTGRGWYVVLGIMSVIAGGIMLVWPFDSIIVLTIVSGVSLVVLGLTRIVQAVQIRKDAKATHETFDSPTQRVAA